MDKGFLNFLPFQEKQLLYSITGINYLPQVLIPPWKHQETRHTWHDPLK